MKQTQLYHNSNLLQSVFKTIGDDNEYFIKENLERFTEPNFKGIDSIRFIVTKSFFSKFVERFILEFREKKLNKQREIFANLGLNCEIGTTQQINITKKIFILAFHTKGTIQKARKSKRALNNQIILAIHGLMQYNHEAKEPIRLDRKTRQILKYLLDFCDHQKKRNAITLKSFDFALDYQEKAEICKDYAISKAEYLDSLNANFKHYKTSLYIQHYDFKKSIKAPLRKIRIYDKAFKNNLKNPLIRFELVFKI